MAAAKRIGVIGTLVWDTIRGREPHRESIEEWGGIAYSLAALDAALSDEWEIVPLIRVGSDLADAARRFLATLPRVSRATPLIEVPYRNNRVVLTYHSNERRTEVLSGGIPPWSWVGLKPLLSGLDALYVNFTSGEEMDLEVAMLLRQYFQGVIYCDLHSLLLAKQPDGLRVPSPLPDALRWCACFDIVQVNEDEAALLAASPLEFASAALAAGVSLIIVTLGSRGAVYFSSGDQPLPDRTAAERHSIAGAAPIRTALVPAAITAPAGMADPTGCGDVWGATYFARALCGDSFSHAFDSAMRAAARNAEYHGATSLAAFLRRGVVTE